MKTLYLSLAISLASFTGVRAAAGNIKSQQTLLEQSKNQNDWKNYDWRQRPFNSRSNIVSPRGLVWYNDEIFSNEDSHYFTFQYNIMGYEETTTPLGLARDIKAFNETNNGIYPLYMPQQLFGAHYSRTWNAQKTEKSQFFDFFTYQDLWNSSYETYENWADQNGTKVYRPQLVNENYEIIEGEVAYALNPGSALTLENGLSTAFNTDHVYKSYDFLSDYFFLLDNNSQYFQRRNSNYDIGVFKSWFSGDKVTFYYPIDLNRGIIRNRLYNRPLFNINECADYLNELTAQYPDGAPYPLFLKCTFPKNNMDNLQYKIILSLVLVYQYQNSPNSLSEMELQTPIGQLISLENEKGDVVNVSDEINGYLMNHTITLNVARPDTQPYTTTFLTPGNGNPVQGNTWALNMNFGTLSSSIILNYNSALHEGGGTYYANGYNAGYNAALQSVADQNTAFGKIGQAFSSMGDLLAIQVLPGLTLGLFLFMPLIIGMMIFIIKMLRN